MVQVTDALIDAGFRDEEIGKVMGGNAMRVLGGALPD
jgi:microsomal dipeptidase-like Zn-dependent dipeptidase